MGTFRPESSEQSSPLSAEQLKDTIAVDTSTLDTPSDPNPEPEKLSGLTMMDTLWGYYETYAYKHDWNDLDNCTVTILPASSKRKDPYNITPLDWRQLTNMCMCDPDGIDYYPPLEDYERLIYQVNNNIVPIEEWERALSEVERCHKFLYSFVRFQRILQFKPLLDFMNLYDWHMKQKRITLKEPDAVNHLELASCVEIASKKYIFRERYQDVQCYSYIYGPEDGVDPNDKRIQDFLDWLGSFIEPDPPWDDGLTFYEERRPTFPYDALPRPERNYREDEFWLRIDFADYYSSLLSGSIDHHYLYYEYKELFDWFAFAYTRLIYEIEEVDAQLIEIIDRHHYV